MPKEEDDLDNFLDDMEQKRGIESTKPISPKVEKPKTSIAQSKNKWGAVATELDDIDDTQSKLTEGKLSGRGTLDNNLAAKKRQLFGGGLTDSRENSENENNKQQNNV